MLVNSLFLKNDQVESRLMTPYFPLGLLYLAAVARDAGYEVSIFDAMFVDSDQAFLHALERENPRVVGVGALTTVRHAALRLTGLAKRAGATVIVGGADPTARPDVYLHHHDQRRHTVDVAVIGEGEETILQLLPRLLNDEGPPSWAEVPGVAFRGQDGEIVRNERRPLRKNLDDLPFPARDLLDLESYRKAWRSRHDHFSLSIIATRGCPYRCSWCQKSVFGRSFRTRSPEAVAEEMALIKRDFAPDHIRIVDDVMGIDRRWVQAFHDAVLGRDAVIPFECLSRVDLMDGEMARLLRETGCRRIHFGAESGSQTVLDSMHKEITVQQIEAAAAICDQTGIETYFYMMVGYPGESWADLQRSVRLLRRTQPDDFSTTIAYPLPGTPFYEEVRDRLIDDGDGSDWRHTAENRILFERGRLSTAFYRRVIRWFHSEWRDAHLGAGPNPSVPTRIRSKLGLWRDRITVRILSRVAGAVRSPLRPTLED